MEMEMKRSLYRTMLRIRRFEETVALRFAAGEMAGFYHLYLGQEAIASGACAALRKDDYITSTHRGHGHVLAKGADMKGMLAEMYGKSTGYCKAKGGSMHIAVPELGILGANGIVGGGIPIATGAAASAKYLKNGRVAVCFFGDGASNQGTFHESLNIASAFQLPVIYVCENNLYGVGTRQSTVRRLENIADRAQSYGMAGAIIDGNDPEAVFLAVSSAVKTAREGGGPTLIECKTYRFHTHFEGEPDTYRSKEEVAVWKQRDPLSVYRKRLTETSVAGERALEDLEREVEEELSTAIEFARNSPLPPARSALDDVYA